jgi:hypothetical protein
VLLALSRHATGLGFDREGEMRIAVAEPSLRNSDSATPRLLDHRIHVVDLRGAILPNLTNKTKPIAPVLRLDCAYNECRALHLSVSLFGSVAITNHANESKRDFVK